VIDTTPPMLVAVGGLSDADQAVARRQGDHNLGRLDWMRIDASGTPASTVARAKAGLVQPDVATDS
jgi:hypothetical protein